MGTQKLKKVPHGDPCVSSPGKKVAPFFRTGAFALKAATALGSTLTGSLTVNYPFKFLTPSLCLAQNLALFSLGTYDTGNRLCAPES